MLNVDKYLGHAIVYLCMKFRSKVTFLRLILLFVTNILSKLLYNTRRNSDKCCFFYNLDVVPRNTLQRYFFIIKEDLLQLLSTKELS